MDDLVITYLLYAISLVLFISLMSYSIINYKAGAQNVVKSSYDLQAAREDYNIGAYTSDGYYISGKSINNLRVSCKAIILHDDDSTYRWVYRDASLDSCTSLQLNNSISNASTTINIQSQDLVNPPENEVYELGTYNVTAPGVQGIIYVIR